MNGYLSPKEACERGGITPYMLSKLLEEGKVREMQTTDITRGLKSLLRFVCLQDILDAKAGLELSFTDIHNVAAQYGVTPGAIRFHIKRRRIRWRRCGMKLQPCSDDVDLFLGAGGQTKIRKRKGKPPNFEMP